MQNQICRSFMNPWGHLGKAQRVWIREGGRDGLFLFATIVRSKISNLLKLFCSFISCISYPLFFHSVVLTIVAVLLLFLLKGLPTLLILYVKALLFTLLLKRAMQTKKSFFICI